MVADIARLEERIDRAAMGAVEISDALGGLRFQNMIEVMEFAKMMAVSGNAVPKHLQGNPGMCLAVCVQALEWRFSPFAVANKSYEVQSRLSFESQLVHAVIEQRAPIKGRIRHTFEGEGEDRRCTVTAVLRDGDPLTYTSPAFKQITPKNSPLWKTKPDLQLYYNTVRDFCRIYFPDVLLGVYAEDELRDSHIGPDRARDVTPKNTIGDRLKNKGSRGFDAAHVERETGGAQSEQVASPALAPDAVSTPQAQAAPANDGGSNEVIGAAGAEPAIGSETNTPTPITETAAESSGSVAENPAPPANVFAAYASKLYEATNAKSLKKTVDQFWLDHEYPESEDDKHRTSKIWSLHVKRIKGDIPADKLAEQLKELIW